MTMPVRKQNVTMTGELPHDRPYVDRPHRIYVATTNHCNRACPWCSTHSSPKGRSWLTLDQYISGLPDSGAFEIQIEGGEPTIHPQFPEQVRIAREHPRCQRLIIVTNGAVLPRSQDPLRAWLRQLGHCFTLKLSINHHLLQHDKGLLPLAVLLHKEVPRCGSECELVLNVRLRKGSKADDQRVIQAVENADLLDVANVFYLQRYGLASNRADWDAPFLVGADFSMMIPGGRALGPDLIARSEAMARLP